MLKTPPLQHQLEVATLKSLKYLEILRPAANSRPKLAVWLDALAEMPELKTLTLNRASPKAPYLPLDVERTITPANAQPSIPSLMGRPIQIFTHHSWANRHQPIGNILPKFMGRPALVRMIFTTGHLRSINIIIAGWACRIRIS